MELNSELDRLKKYNIIEAELNRAKEKHPDWPTEIFKQLSIMQEEAGGVTKAVNEYCLLNRGSLQEVKDELVQTAAMCMRMIESLEESDYLRLKQQVDELTHEEMCRMWRFNEGSRVYFDSTNKISDYFRKRLFEHFHGFTPEISKKIGWKK